MQTNFTLAQLADPDIADAESVLRKCVHCGFCLATCPTYVTLGDELDSPRGRIYLIREMLETGVAPPARVVKHIDRCLSCLSCMTTCPSGVNYMHLVDHARVHIERTFRRPPFERLLRSVLAWLLPRPGWFRLALLAALPIRPLARWLPGRLGAIAAMAPAKVAPRSPVDTPQVFAATGVRRRRVALLTGCAQQVLSPAINEATIRVLTRHGCEVVVAPGMGCCGALVHHMGRIEPARAAARDNIAAWLAAIDDGGLDAIVINASGCGTIVKEYGHLLRNDADWAAPAARISALAKDIGEVLAELDLTAVGDAASGPLVAYHSACSLQHGQGLGGVAKDVLTGLGFTVRDVPEGHLCCGSAGTYNLMQPAIANQLRARKVANIESLSPAVVAAGNIGCIAQIAGATDVPVVHPVELVDWATGGPAPAGLGGRRQAS